MWDKIRENFRENALQYRGYRGFNKFDSISLVVVGVGALVLLVGFLLDSGGLGVFGVFVLFLGLYILMRDFPSQ